MNHWLNLNLIIPLTWQALKFIAYYKETVNDSPDETYRVRPVDIYYFMEDDSMMVQEPIVQVCIISIEVN